MSRGERRGRVRRRRALVWHRRLGIAAAAVLVVVVVSGIPLNHVEPWGLDREIVSDATLLGWYGMDPQGAPVAYKVGSEWLTWLDGSLFLNDRRLGETATAVGGAVAVDNLFYVAARHEMLVFAGDGSLVEKVSGMALPGPIKAIGLSEGDRVALRTPTGQFSATTDLLDWTPDAAPVDWVQPATLPPELETAIVTSYLGPGIPWSRLLLDIHSGRILGAWGPYLIDAAALALLLLVGTGLYNWLRDSR